MNKINRTPFDFNDYESAGSDFERNRILFEWLADDTDRTALYAHLATRPHRQQTLEFPSRAHLQDDPAPPRSLPIKQGHSKAYLLTDRADIEYALTHPAEFSNAPYKELGTGSFMLALDPGGSPDWHAKQRQVAEDVLLKRGTDDKLIDKLAAVASSEAEVVLLAGRFFDLATLAEQTAVRFCGLLFGFAGRDHDLLTEALHKAYRALNYQILGRHFVAEPGTLPAAQHAMGRLLTRTAELIDDYQRLDRYPPAAPRPFDHHKDRRRLPEGVEPVGEFGLSGLEPVLCRLARKPSGLSGQDLAVLAVGMMAGIVGNVQASVCIAVDAILNSKTSVQDLIGHEAAPSKTLRDRIAAELRTNPPVAFLPRRALKTVTLPKSGPTVPADSECILAMGGTSLSACPYPPDKSYNYDPLNFGEVNLQGQPRAPHWCLGEHLARPLVERIVWNTLRLPGLAQRLDAVNGEPIRLEKLWGFACIRYPLLYKREKRLAQQPLNVVMRIKSPVPENAERLKRVIRDGAPRIERALRKARHVHFAWFELLDHDTRLALHTVYDGDFDAYIEHFALEVDDLFDQLFACIEGGPPLPVAEHVIEFVETIRRHNLAPVGGYLFSAYRRSEVPDIQRGSFKERS